MKQRQGVFDRDGWRQALDGLRRVRDGTSTILVAAATELVRVVVRRVSDAVVTAGARIAKKVRDNLEERRR